MTMRGIAGNTLINTPGGHVEIQRIKGFTQAYTHCGRWRNIAAVFNNGSDELFRVQLDTPQLGHPRHIDCTLDHRLWTPGGWKAMRQLSAGGLVFTLDSEEEFTQIEIDTIVSLGVQPVWDLVVENDHSYLAQGFVNHNSAQIQVK